VLGISGNYFRFLYRKLFDVTYLISWRGPRC